MLPANPRSGGVSFHFYEGRADEDEGLFDFLG